MIDDLVGPRPRIVFCGMAGLDDGRLREHYYETPGNNFWESLHASGLVPEPLGPTDDARLPAFGLGLTDLVHGREPWPEATRGYRDVYDVDALEAKLRRWRPQWLALTSKTVAHAAARTLGERPPGLGPADLYLGGVQAFVLPGTSGANRRHDYDGRPTRIAWWRDLAALTDPS